MLVLDDALLALGRFSPAFLGVRISPVRDTLRSLRPLLTGLAPDAPCPMQPLACNKSECQDNA